MAIINAIKLSHIVDETSSNNTNNALTAWLPAKESVAKQLKRQPTDRPFRQWTNQTNCYLKFLLYSYSYFEFNIAIQFIKKYILQFIKYAQICEGRYFS